MKHLSWRTLFCRTCNGPRPHNKRTLECHTCRTVFDASRTDPEHGRAA